MHKNEGQAPIERVVTERTKKKKYWSFRGNQILCPRAGLAGGVLRGG